LLQVEAESADGDDALEVVMTETAGIINADLTVGANVVSAEALQANSGLSNVGMGLYGAGFQVTPAEAEKLGLGILLGLEQHIRPYLNGRDMMQKSRSLMVIDLFGLSPEEVIAKYPAIYQRVFELVKPARDTTQDKSTREKWWLFGRPRSELRPAFVGLTRFIVTTQTAKHRVFMFLDGNTVPDNTLFVIASESSYHLGVLSSRLHVAWSMATGGWLGVGNDSRYNGTRCFDPFPFPAATPAQQARIRELAEALDAHRKRQQAQHPGLTLTDLYNVVEKLRAGQLLSAKEQTTHEQGLAAVVLSLHQQLDAAVAAAYGWPADLPEAELLTRLVQLNHQRRQEEAAGNIRYLRPAYQAPSINNEQLIIDNVAVPAKPVLIDNSSLHITLPWPDSLAQQMLAVRAVVQQAAQPLSSAEVAARFRRTRPERVQPLLDTLELMALVRVVEGQGMYAG
jgi:hypothetical protein